MAWVANEVVPCGVKKESSTEVFGRDKTMEGTRSHGPAGIKFVYPKLRAAWDSGN